MRRWLAALLLMLTTWTGAAHADRIDELLPAAELQGDELYRKDSPESFGDWLARMVPVQALTGPQKPFFRSYALVIGVSEYGDSLTALPSTADNPKRMRDLLIGQNFDLVITLSNVRATKDRIEYLMSDFFPGIVTESDRFLFYFSGHGVVQASGEGFLPLTASRGNYSRMLPMRNVWTWDGSLGTAKQVLFLLDACFSGLATAEAQATPRELAIDQLAQRGHHLITAATSGQQTIASQQFSGSIFTDSLIDAAQGTADVPITWDADGDGKKEKIKDGVVSIYELLNEVRAQVRIKAASLGWCATITPQLRPLRDSQGEFFFVTQERVQETVRGAGQAIVESQGGSAATPTGFDPRAIEWTFWQSVERGGQCADFRDYLERYPDGAYASLARRRAADLCRAPTDEPTQPPVITSTPQPAGPAASTGAPLLSGTSTLIHSPDPIAAESALALTSADWTEIQRDLATLGYEVVADGRPGEQTRAAIAAWQLWVSQAPTRFLTADQRSQLASEAQKRRAEVASQRRPGTVFRDTRATGQACPECPEMVVIPAGSFTMGSPDSEPERDSDEGPRHPVTISADFAIGRYEVTFDEWDACVRAGKCRNVNTPWGRGRQPVINVNWDDAQTYTKWLSQLTGKPYRLPSEAEWEYSARGNTDTPFWTGSTISTAQANYDGNYVYGSGVKGVYRQKAVAVDEPSFPSNPFGLYHVHGNVWEWVEDCYHDTYGGAPRNGSAWTSSCAEPPRRVLRGGSWDDDPRYLRSANRDGDAPENRFHLAGFRVARTFTP